MFFLPVILLDEDEWVDGDDEEEFAHVPYSHPRYPEETMLQRSKDFYGLMSQRRSVRFISSEPVSRRVIDNIILTAGTQINSQSLIAAKTKKRGILTLISAVFVCLLLCLNFSD